MNRKDGAVKDRKRTPSHEKRPVRAVGIRVPRCPACRLPVSQGDEVCPDCDTPLNDEE